MTRFIFDQCPMPIVGWGTGWLVTHKPSGISIHNDPGKDLCSLLDGYFRSHPDQAASIAFSTQFGIHPVHRLDKETSGVILLSCRRQVFDQLSRQFAQGKVSKRYLALAHGSVRSSMHGDLWKWPLTAKAAGRRNPQGKGHRIPCQTQYRLIEHSTHYSLIECHLVSGRTHQIRRHATLAGHPLVGDRRYGSLRACRYLEQTHNFNRLALHAAGLTFHPTESSDPQSFAVPELPGSIQQLFDDDCENVLPGD